MSETLAAAVLLSTPGFGPKTVASFLDRLDGECLFDAVTADTTTLVERFGLKKDLAVQLANSAVDIHRHEAAFCELGIVAVFRTGSDYPTKLIDVLGRDAPPILFIKGNLDVASRPSVGFCGSRKASERGLEVAHSSAAALAGKGVVAVSGYAAGVDLAVHRAALEAGGATIFVLAEGILHFRTKREVAESLTPDNHLIISEFPPNVTWQAHNAMRRNNTIIGLSDAMIVIESGTTGGTYACGVATLKHGRPLFVAEYSNPPESAAGNQYFLTRGASPFRGNHEGTPNIASVLAAMGKGKPTRTQREQVPTLF